jgi:hypothetical protein
MPPRTTRNPRVTTSLAPSPSPAPAENFDLGNASDSDEAAHSDADLDIEANDPDAIRTNKPSSADDVIYFFHKTGKNSVCRECK